MSNKYCFDIPEGGDSPHNILDYCFNISTQDFLLKSGLTEGMNVLECGCGAGVMSSWIADQVGANGQLLAIDSSQEQLVSANKLSQENAHNHVTFVCQDVYDIPELDQTFDLVYCRFILHHLERPREVITKMLALLKPGGIIAIEEGIVNHAFVYPYNESFGNERFNLLDYHDNTEGERRDGNFGLKLYHSLHNAGVLDLSINLVAPVLASREEKAMLLAGFEGSKRFSLESGISEKQWQERLKQMHQLINDEAAVVGFYQSVQVSGKKQS